MGLNEEGGPPQPTMGTFIFSLDSMRMGGQPYMGAFILSLDSMRKEGPQPTMGAFIFSLDSMRWEHSFSPWIQ